MSSTVSSLGGNGASGPSSAPSLPSSPPKQGDAALHQKAQDFEAMFLSQMLQQAKIGMPQSGENDPISQNFSSFMSKAYADQIVKSGGIGLSESILQALKEGPR